MSEDDPKKSASTDSPASVRGRETLQSKGEDEGIFSSDMLSEPPSAIRSASIPPHLAPGLVVGDKYELVRRLGTGAMGEVWAARHMSLHEEVAIKLVMRGVAHDDGTSAESRFLLEARVAASLSRKTRHIVAVTDHGQDGPLGYLVMELLAGESLDQRIQRTGPLPVAKVAPLVTQIARALAIAHSEGVVHRDLKPSNVFVTADEEGHALAKVLDFGIAKLRRTTDKRAAHITRRGFLLGTPAYMSPEQARGKPIDHRTDVWALAVIAYHLLTGEFPFDGETGEELFARICRVEPISLHERLPDAPAVVNDFFVRAFATRVEDRFQSAMALAGAFQQLEPLAQGSKISAPPPAALAMGEAEIAAIGLGVRSSRSPSSSKAGVSLEPSIIAAGLPQKNGAWKALFAVALLGLVFSLSGVVLSVYYERDPAAKASPTGIAVGVSVVEPPSRPIPPPEPAASLPPIDSAAPSVAASALPPATVARAAPPVIVQGGPRGSAHPTAAASTAATPAIAPSPARHDRSDVF